MEENEGKVSIDTEELKNETKDTVNQIKDSIKNVDFKKDTEDTKGFLKEMFSNPFNAIKKVVKEEENVLSKVVIIMIAYITMSVLSSIITILRYGQYAGFGNNLLTIVSAALHPIFVFLVPAIIVFIMNRKNKKPLITIINTLVIAGIPTAINSAVHLLQNLITGASIITGPISTMLSGLALVLTYFGMKDIFEEEDEGFIKKYAIIKLIAAFILVILTRIGIN